MTKDDLCSLLQLLCKANSTIVFSDVEIKLIPVAIIVKKDEIYGPLVAAASNYSDRKTFDANRVIFEIIFVKFAVIKIFSERTNVKVKVGFSEPLIITCALSSFLQSELPEVSVVTLYAEFPAPEP
ncbi:MAG: hypothetical protein HUJ51_05065 [Eggerthellaceae bacterium]|nr:hypothetical protein [Eggerthellaceae bacterium]